MVGGGVLLRMVVVVAAVRVLLPGAMLQAEATELMPTAFDACLMPRRNLKMVHK